MNFVATLEGFARYRSADRRPQKNQPTLEQRTSHLVSMALKTFRQPLACRQKAYQPDAMWARGIIQTVA
ncbi:hypothetical protein [Sphingomonas piscis]|uniref:hypothetical protein n=1 Tax=Sphingomonas piscis TaxID=2714943 RepID=UPI0019D2F557|nr:hypothetical protein [Sphingomonas piscis]